jgi:hypothetical protein
MPGFWGLILKTLIEVILGEKKQERHGEIEGEGDCWHTMETTLLNPFSLWNYNNHPPLLVIIKVACYLYCGFEKIEERSDLWDVEMSWQCVCMNNFTN